jgi:hypothetical protein
MMWQQSEQNAGQIFMVAYCGFVNDGLETGLLLGLARCATPESSAKVISERMNPQMNP